MSLPATIGQRRARNVIGLGPLGSCITLCILTLVFGGIGCGGKPPEEEPAEKADDVETSLGGSVSKTYKCDLAQCVGAATSALQTLNIRVLNESGAIFKKSLDAESQDGISIGVQVTEMTKETTRISIKVGRLFGDEYAARRIHNEIESELATHGVSKQKWQGFSGFGKIPEQPKGTSKAGVD